MYVSKLTLKPETAHQESTQTKILKWMQEHPNALNSTNSAQLARTMRISGVTTGTARQVVQKMVNNQVLERFGGKRRARYHINYLHKDIPADILASAPLEEQLRVKQTLGRLKPGQYLDDIGCTITPAPKNTGVQTPLSPEEPTEEPKQVAEEEADTPTATKEIAVPVKVEQDGSSINITINLTINTK